MLKKTKTFFNYKMKIKTTTTRLINELKYSSMSEGNTCIAEPNLEVLPLRIIQSRNNFSLKVFKNNVWSDDTYKVSLLHYQTTTNSAVNRNLLLSMTLKVKSKYKCFFRIMNEKF